MKRNFHTVLSSEKLTNSILIMSWCRLLNVPLHKIYFNVCELRSIHVHIHMT